MAVPGDQEVSFRLWPPSDSTRALLVEKMATNLASISFFSLKYGRIDKGEASKHAKRIEEEAFVVAQQQECQSDSATVQMYAKQASRLMLEALKAAGKRGNLSVNHRRAVTRSNEQIMFQFRIRAWHTTKVV